MEGRGREGRVADSNLRTAPGLEQEGGSAEVVPGGGAWLGAVGREPSLATEIYKQKQLRLLSARPVIPGPQSFVGDSPPPGSHGSEGGQDPGFWVSLWGPACSWALGKGRHTHLETAFEEVLVASPSWSLWAGVSQPTERVSIPPPAQAGTW